MYLGTIRGETSNSFELCYNGHVYTVSNASNFEIAWYDVVKPIGSKNEYLFVLCTVGSATSGAATRLGYMVLNGETTEMTFGTDSLGSLIDVLKNIFCVRGEMGDVLIIAKATGFNARSYYEDAATLKYINVNLNGAIKSSATNGSSIVSFGNSKLSLYGLKKTDTGLDLCPFAYMLELIEQNDIVGSVDYIAYDGSQYIMLMSNKVCYIEDRLNSLDSGIKEIYTLDFPPPDSFVSTFLHCGIGWVQISGASVWTKGGFIPNNEAYYVRVRNSTYKVLVGTSAAKVIFPGQRASTETYPAREIIQV